MTDTVETIDLVAEYDRLRKENERQAAELRSLRDALRELLDESEEVFDFLVGVVRVERHNYTPAILKARAALEEKE